MVEHYRAAADMVVKWALSEAESCDVEINEWFPSLAEKLRFLAEVNIAKPNLHAMGMLKKVAAWIERQASDWPT